ncbi:unnamed protein product [Closterium sp. NIES-65]|nr:unnamed protein product [Closterium sp. NIES-65]
MARYGPLWQVPERRAAAEATLLELRKSPHALQACTHLLDNSGNAVACFQAAATLQQVVLRDWPRIPTADHTSLHRYCLDHIVKRAVAREEAQGQAGGGAGGAGGGGGGDAFVEQKMVAVLAVLVKRAWMDVDDTYKTDLFSSVRAHAHACTCLSPPHHPKLLSRAACVPFLAWAGHQLSRLKLQCIALHLSASPVPYVPCIAPTPCLPPRPLCAHPHPPHQLRDLASGSRGPAVQRAAFSLLDALVSEFNPASATPLALPSDFHNRCRIAFQRHFLMAVLMVCVDAVAAHMAAVKAQVEATQGHAQGQGQAQGGVVWGPSSQAVVAAALNVLIAALSWDFTGGSVRASRSKASDDGSLSTARSSSDMHTVQPPAEWLPLLLSPELLSLLASVYAALPHTCAPGHDWREGPLAERTRQMAVLLCSLHGPALTAADPSLVSMNVGCLLSLLLQWLSPLPATVAAVAQAHISDRELLDVCRALAALIRLHPLLATTPAPSAHANANGSANGPSCPPTLLGLLGELTCAVLAHGAASDDDTLDGPMPHALDMLLDTWLAFLLTVCPAHPSRLPPHCMPHPPISPSSSLYAPPTHLAFLLTVCPAHPSRLPPHCMPRPPISPSSSLYAPPTHLAFLLTVCPAHPSRLPPHCMPRPPISPSSSLYAPPTHLAFLLTVCPAHPSRLPPHCMPRPPISPSSSLYAPPTHLAFLLTVCPAHPSRLPPHCMPRPPISPSSSLYTPPTHLAFLLTVCPAHPSRLPPHCMPRPPISPSSSLYAPPTHLAFLLTVCPAHPARLPPHCMPRPPISPSSSLYAPPTQLAFLF